MPSTAHTWPCSLQKWCPQRIELLHIVHCAAKLEPSANHPVICPRHGCRKQERGLGWSATKTNVGVGWSSKKNREKWNLLCSEGKRKDVHHSGLPMCTG